MPTTTPPPEQLFELLKRGDRGALARAITLLESTLPSDTPARLRLLEKCIPPPENTLRIAITGAPGSGKSTLIDALGMLLLGQSHRVAVLAIDPTSRRTGGSIMGDKTRMTRLAAHPDAFIRPSPTSGVLGGVAETTRESIAVCEAAGFDRILVETVGVGQSETRVADMVDLVVMVGLAGTGDSLQGIKRGILETASLVVINKADGTGISVARRAASELKSALRLLRGPHASVQVTPVSALEHKGLEELVAQIEEAGKTLRDSGQLARLRAEQQVAWFHEAVSARLKALISRDDTLSAMKHRLSEEVLSGKRDPFGAADELVSSWLQRNA